MNLADLVKDEMQNDAILAVIKERKNQDIKHGEIMHPPSIWMDIIMEEVGEASKESLNMNFAQGTQEYLNAAHRMYDELIQVSASALAAAESMHGLVSATIKFNNEIEELKD